MKFKSHLFTILKVSLIIVMFLGAIHIAQNRPTNSIFVNKYAAADVVYADGKTAHFDNKNFGMLSTGDAATVHLNLPEEPLVDDAVLAFYIYHSVTEIWCGERLLDSYGAEIAANGDLVGNKRFLVSVPDEAWGGEITIKLCATEDDAFNRIKNLRMYEAKNAYQYYIDADFMGFWISLPLFLFGLVALIMLLLNGKFDVTARKGVYIALFAILAASWIFASKGVQHLFGFDGYFGTILEFIAVFTMVIPVLLYALETETDKIFSRLLAVAAVVNILFFALATVLNFTNIAHYSKTLLTSNIMTLISGILLLTFAIRRKAAGSKSDKVFFGGMVIMFCAGLFDLLRINFFKYIPGIMKISLPSVLPLGVLFFIIYMLRSYIAEISERNKRMIVSEVRADELQRMVEEIPTGVCVFKKDAQFSVIEANDLFYNFLGYTKESALAAGTANLLVLLDKEGQKILQEKAAAARSLGISQGETEITLHDFKGAVRTILTKYYSSKTSDHITISVIDITDRKQMEENLRVSEERYKLALSQSGKVFFFFDVPTRTMRLSQELADAFGLPLVVDNMPENFISRGLVEQESIENYRHFYERILAGEPSGETIISCHMRQTPQHVLWYKIAFTSVFDDRHNPMSAIITYEDINEQHKAELSSRWKQLNLISVPENNYMIIVCDLTRNRFLDQSGKMFFWTPETVHDYNAVNKSVSGYDEIIALVLERFFYAEDVEVCRSFLDRQRLLDMFAAGKTEDHIEYRSLRSDSAYRWTSAAISLIEDPYNGHVVAQLLLLDIHESKSGEIQMKRSMEELKKELDNSRIKVMINQMQPHFLYNALSAIQTIVKIDPDYAYQLIYDFTVHLRSSIKALSSDAPIPFADELKNIKAYLNIEKMRFGDDLEVKYEIDCENFEVIPLSIQPLTENAARHGVYPKGKEGGVVTIRTYETVTAYVVEVEDSGVGFDVQQVLNSNTDSVGLKNLIFRLKSLMNASVAIASEIGKGTRVTVSIPKEAEANENNLSR